MRLPFAREAPHGPHAAGLPPHPPTPVPPCSPPSLRNPRVRPAAPPPSPAKEDRRVHFSRRFAELQAEWRRVGRVDARYEQLVDDIVGEVGRGGYPLPQGFADKYARPEGGVVGSGSNGRLFRSHALASGRPVAVKVTLAMYGAAQELAMLRHCQGPRVVELLDHFGDDCVSMLVMELGGTPWTADNPLLRSIPSLSFRPPSPTHKRINLMDMHGCLRSHESLPPTALRTLFRGAAEAVLFLHREKGVAHGDLKPQNLLVDERYGVKVADFSAARGTGEGRVRRFAGAPMFGAPEALGGDFDGELNDIWALGVILYMLRYGPDREPEFAQAGAATRVVLPADSMPDDGEIKDLLSRMLDRDPSRRPRIEQVAAHPFVGLLPPSERDGDRATGTKEGKRPLETEGSDATLGEATRGKGLRGWLGRIAG